MKLREELDAACNGPRGWVSAKFVSAAYVLMDKADGIIAEREETIRQLRAQLDEYERDEMTNSDGDLLALYTRVISVEAIKGAM